MTPKYCISCALKNECTSAMKQQWFCLGGEKHLGDTGCVHINTCKRRKEEDGEIAIFQSHRVTTLKRSTRPCIPPNFATCTTRPMCFDWIRMLLYHLSYVELPQFPSNRLSKLNQTTHFNLIFQLQFTISKNYPDP